MPWNKLTRNVEWAPALLGVSLVAGHYIAGSYDPGTCHSPAVSAFLSIFYVVASRLAFLVAFSTISVLAVYTYRRWLGWRSIRAAEALRRQLKVTKEATPDLDLSYLKHSWIHWFVLDTVADVWNVTRVVVVSLFLHGFAFWVLALAALFAPFRYGKTAAATYLCATDLKSVAVMYLVGLVAAAVFVALARLVTKLDVSEWLLARTSETSRPWVVAYDRDGGYSMYWLHSLLYTYDRECREGNILYNLIDTKCRSLPRENSDLLRYLPDQSFFRWELLDLDGNCIYSIHISGRVYQAELDQEIRSLIPVIASTIRERLQARQAQEATKEQ